MDKPLIALRQVSKTYKGHHALAAVDLDIHHGEFLTLLGPSGCGKTTLLRLLSGLDFLDEGEMYLNGVNMAKVPPERRHIHMVFQSYALFPHMTVYDNVAFGPQCQKLPPAEIHSRVMEALERVKLAAYAHRKPQSLSGGQQQRVAIARAVVNRPLLLLLDEPLSALDYNLRKTMQIELKQLQRRLGITFVLVTHDQEEALSISDRVAVMNLGNIEQIGTPRDIYEEPRNLFVAKFVGTANIFKTSVLKADQSFVEVVVEDKLFRLRNKRNHAMGDRVAIVVRPEDITITKQPKADELPQMLPGVIEQVIYKGSTVDLILRLDSGRTISATEFFDEDNEDLAYEIGERTWVSWVAGWEVILADEE